MNDKENNMKPKIEYIHVLKEFEDILPEEVPGLPPKNGYRLHNQFDTWSGTNIESSISNEHNRTHRTKITITITNQ